MYRKVPMERKRSLVVAHLRASVSTRSLVTAITLSCFFLVPGLHAQLAEASDKSAQATIQVAPQPTAQNPTEQNSLPPEIRPGHALNPADVEILTGKRDRELEAARRRTAAPVVVDTYGGYGSYGNYYRLDGSIGVAWEVPILPLARIGNPFFFSRLSSRGTGRGGFRGGR